MIDIHSEKIETLAEAAANTPGRPNVSTIWRWCMKGVGGVRLESVVIGGQRFTSREARQRHADRLTAVHEGESPAPTSKRRKAVDAANAELDAAGI